MKRRLVSFLAAGMLLLSSAGAAMSVHAEGTWSPIRGYNGETGSLEASGGVTSLTGYGGVKYTERIPVEEGTTITLTVSPKVLLSMYGNLFTVALLDTENSFVGSDADTGSGFAVSARSFAKPETGFNNWYHRVTAGEATEVDLTRSSNRINKEDGSAGNVNHSMVATDLQITLIKRAQKVLGIDCSWEIRLTAVQSGDKLVYHVPAADVPNDMFADGVWLSAGYRMAEENEALNTVKVNISSPSVSLSGSEEPTPDPDPDPEPDPPAEGDLFGGFQNVRGYGQGNTGKGLSEQDGRVRFDGFGGAAYTAKPVKTAVAVEFQLHSYPAPGTYWFSIGLVNKKGTFWTTDGTESQGLATLITSFTNEEGINVIAKKVKTSGTTDIGTISSTVKAKDTNHILAIFKEGEEWVFTIDGAKTVSVAASEIDLGEESWLCIGANKDPSMAMSVSNVYIDDAVTDAMKSGSGTPSGGGETGGNTGGNTGSSGSNGGTSYDKDGNVIIGEIVKGGALEYMGPKNVVTRLKPGISPWTYVTAGAAGVTLVISVVFAALYLVRHKKKSAPLQADDTENNPPAIS